MSTTVFDDKKECSDGNSENKLERLMTKQWSELTLEASSLPSHLEDENEQHTVEYNCSFNNAAASTASDEWTQHNVSAALKLPKETHNTTSNNITPSISIAAATNENDDDNTINDSTCSETNSHTFSSLYSSYSSEITASPDSRSALSKTETPELSSRRSTQILTEANDALFLYEKSNIDAKNNANKSREINTDNVNNKYNDSLPINASKESIAANFKSITTICAETNTSSHSPCTVMPLPQFTPPPPPPLQKSFCELNSLSSHNALQQTPHVLQSSGSIQKHPKSEVHSSYCYTSPEEQSEFSLLSLLQPSSSVHKTVNTAAAANQSTMMESTSENLPLTSSESTTTSTSTTTTTPASSSTTSKALSDQVQVCNTHELLNTSIPITPSSIGCIAKNISREPYVKLTKETCNSTSKLIVAHSISKSNKGSASTKEKESNTVNNNISGGDKDICYYYDNSNKYCNDSDNNYLGFNKHKSTTMTPDSATQNVNSANNKISRYVPKQPIRKRLFSTSFMFDMKNVKDASASSSNDANLSIKEMFPSFNKTKSTSRACAMRDTNEKGTLSSSISNSSQGLQQSKLQSVVENKSLIAAKFNVTLPISFFSHSSQTSEKKDNSNKDSNSRSDDNNSTLTTSNKIEMQDKNLECRKGGLSCASSIKFIHTELSSALRFVYLNSHGGSSLLVDECLRYELYNRLLKYYVPSVTLGSVDGLLLFYQVLLVTYKCEELLPWNCFVNLLNPEDYIIYENYIHVKNCNLLREANQELNNDFKQTSNVIINILAHDADNTYVSESRNKFCRKDTITFDEFVEFVELLSLRHKHNEYKFYA